MEKKRITHQERLEAITPEKIDVDGKNHWR
jgi:hypothetical protein